jgi:hypothetical protein
MAIAVAIATTVARVPHRDGPAVVVDGGNPRSRGAAA